MDAKREVDDARAVNAGSLNASRVTYFDRRYSRLLRAGRNELPVLPIDKNRKRGKKKQHKVKNLHDHLVNHKKEVLGFLYDQGAKTFCRIRSVKKQGHNVFSALCDTFEGAALIPSEEKNNTCEIRLSSYVFKRIQKHIKEKWPKGETIYISFYE